MAPLNGLRNELQRDYRINDYLDLVNLKPTDITVEVQGNDPGIDWSSLLYIKNCRVLGRDAETIVWCRSSGFFKTTLSPKQVVELRMATGVITWLDMFAHLRLLGYSKQSVPFVMGNLRLIQIGMREGNHTSWLNLHHVNTVNSSNTSARSRVLLNGGDTIIVNERIAVLKRKMMIADRIFENQQKYLELAKVNHGEETPYGTRAEIITEFKQFRQCSAVLLAEAFVYRLLGREDVSADEIRKVVRAAQMDGTIARIEDPVKPQFPLRR